MFYQSEGSKLPQVKISVVREETGLVKACYQKFARDPNLGPNSDANLTSPPEKGLIRSADMTEMKSN